MLLGIRVRTLAALVFPLAACSANPPPADPPAPSEAPAAEPPPAAAVASEEPAASAAPEAAAAPQVKRRDDSIPDDYVISGGDCVLLGKKLGALTRSDESAKM